MTASRHGSLLALPIGVAVEAATRWSSPWSLSFVSRAVGQLTSGVLGGWVRRSRVSVAM